MTALPYRIESGLVVAGDVIADNIKTLSEVYFTTDLLEPGGTQDFTIEAGSIYHLLLYGSSTPSWIRFYGSDAARDSDTRTEPGGNYPTAGSEFYAELTTLDPSESIRLSPVPVIQADGSGLTYVRIVNTGFSTQTIEIQLLVFPIY